MGHIWRSIQVDTQLWLQYLVLAWFHWDPSGCGDRSSDFCWAGCLINGVLVFGPKSPLPQPWNWPSKCQCLILRCSRVPGMSTQAAFIEYSATTPGNADQPNLGPGAQAPAIQIQLEFPHLILLYIFFPHNWPNSSEIQQDIIIEGLLCIGHCVSLLWGFQRTASPIMDGKQRKKKTSTQRNK